MNARKILAIAAIAMSVLAAHAGKNNWTRHDRYAADNKAVIANGGAKVVFLGNSITERWMGLHPEFFKENGYTPRGISGQTSYQMLVRFREDVIKLHPKVVVINAGTNDVAENSDPYVEEITIGNIRSMVELAKLHKIKVVLTSVLPAAGFGWNRDITDAPQKIKSLNQRIMDLAKEKKLPYVDYYTYLVDKKGGFFGDYCKDGVHPELPGYYVMEEVVQNTLKKFKL